MPYKLVRLAQDHYGVMNTEKHTMTAKDTTEEKAKKQIRLLQALEHGMKPGSYSRK